MMSIFSSSFRDIFLHYNLQRKVFVSDSINTAEDVFMIGQYQLLILANWYIGPDLCVTLL